MTSVYRPGPRPGRLDLEATLIVRYCLGDGLRVSWLATRDNPDTSLGDSIPPGVGDTPHQEVTLSFLHLHGRRRLRASCRSIRIGDTLVGITTLGSAAAQGGREEQGQDEMIGRSHEMDDTSPHEPCVRQPPTLACTHKRLLAAQIRFQFPGDYLTPRSRQEQHRVAIAVEAQLLGDSPLIERENGLTSGQSSNEHQERALGEVKIRQEPID